MSAGGAAHHRRRPTLTFLVIGLLLLLLVAPSAPRVDPGRPAAGADAGMDLIRRGAEAARVTPFRGVHTVSVPHNGAMRTEEAEVVHDPGEGTGFAASSDTDVDNGRHIVMDHPAPAGWLEERALQSLERNYRVARAGTSTVAGRTAQVVEARRGDGHVAGRFWIDEHTSLPLGREVYAATGEVTRSFRFVTLNVGGEAEALPASVGQSEYRADALPHGERMRLAKRGWTLPERLSWNLPLVEAWSTPGRDGRVVHLSYSDGLSNVSVFVQRGRLGAESAGTTSGMRPVIEGGETTYVDDSEKSRRMWESGGFVYTVLADAPPEMVGTAYAELPTAQDSGFWTRVGRGFERLGSRIAGAAGR